MVIQNEHAIRTTVRTAVEAFAQGFEARHEAEHGDPEGTLNSKIHNVFIALLGEDLQYYSALVRSLDSSLGNMLEKMAINIARLFYDVEQSVTGPLFAQQTSVIAELLEAYKNPGNPLRPSCEHYARVRAAATE
jgi:hypothetical protein